MARTINTGDLNSALSSANTAQKVAFVAQVANTRGSAANSFAGNGATSIAVVSISQVAYDALAVKDPNTLYVIPEV